MVRVVCWARAQREARELTAKVNEGVVVQTIEETTLFAWKYFNFDDEEA